MFGCDCIYWNQQQQSVDFGSLPEPQPFSLPAPLPQWPQGQGFGTGIMNLGELEVIQVTKFESAWRCIQLGGGKTPLGVSFYKPVGIPDGFHSLGYYCHPDDQQPLRGYVLVAREINHTRLSSLNPPPLRKPINYSLIWSTGSHYGDNGYFWLPNPPTGYKAMGIVVTHDSDQPDIDEVRCVRADLTEPCETGDLVFSMDSKSGSNQQFQIWTTKPCEMGMLGKGVSVGTFYCRSSIMSSEEALMSVACLKNLDAFLTAMPNLNQVHSLIQHYGPIMYFHPDEDYLPSSVQWFFKNGALLYKDDWKKGQPINYMGSNLPSGGENDGGYWIDLPIDDGESSSLKSGNLESAELYVHVKPALGGSFTDVAMWVFCPFNGPVTLKIGLVSIPMSRLGQHVGDWEHVTLRISNFTGELWQVFYSEHSGGRWVDASEVEFIKGSNKPIVYSSKHGHASFPHEGMFLQGSTKFGIGVRNDTARSDYFIDSSVKYQLIAAEYLGEELVEEPCWLQYMREWGPTVVYGSRSEIDKIINILPFFVRFSVENLIELFPTELYGEEGPTGPKEKDNWVGDEIC
ncbi:unnamed protein product [Linum tenue]|uniref:Vacuolar protein sorting-associated protein 62 n=1 Tax=Linum tenue TaxID=586396 RepID=A0AAV0HIV3_9ROSI|nr:unnamed protein product [Linum tenue]